MECAEKPILLGRSHFIIHELHFYSVSIVLTYTNSLGKAYCLIFRNDMVACIYQFTIYTCTQYAIFQDLFTLLLYIAHGTFVGSMRLEHNKPQQIPIDITISFGASTRTYTLRKRPQAIQAVTSSLQDGDQAGESLSGLLGLPESETEMDVSCLPSTSMCGSCTISYAQHTIIDTQSKSTYACTHTHIMRMHTHTHTHAQMCVHKPHFL